MSCKAGAKPLQRGQQQGGAAPSSHLPPVPWRSSASKQNQAKEGRHLPPYSHLGYLPACPYTGHAMTRASSCADRQRMCCSQPWRCFLVSQGVGNTVTHLEVVVQLWRCRALLHGAQTNNLCAVPSEPPAGAPNPSVTSSGRRNSHQNWRTPHKHSSPGPQGGT